MAKPTTGRIEHEPVPEPDPDQMATDTLMTSVFSGICLIVATVVLAGFAALGHAVGGSLGDLTGAKIGVGIGLAVGIAVIAWALRRYADQIRARSANLYRGAWIGSLVSLAIIVLMAYFPQVVIPQYCPPGQVCSSGVRQ